VVVGQVAGASPRKNTLFPEAGERERECLSVVRESLSDERVLYAQIQFQGCCGAFRGAARR
jgi:hypothetical protein